VSKPPAKSAASSKKAVGKPAAASKKAAPATKKPAAKTPAAKPVTKTAAARPAAKKAAVKPAPKSSKPMAKPAAKPAPAKSAKSTPAAAKPAAVKKPSPVPVTKTALKTVAAVAPAATPKPEVALAVAPAAKPTGRAAAKAARNVHVSPALPEPAQVSRFADRFAPVRSVRPTPVDDMPRQAVKVDPKLVNAWKTKAGRDLTEPELLSMPEPEYMNEKQLDFFRMRLTALKDDLLSNAGETTEHLREDTSIVPDPADRATIEEEHALELRTRDRERKLLKKISQSLARIEAGDYGYCDETGEPIGLPRLLARPTATLSLEAQQRREMKQKMFGD
jgi:DnaK suppressor protein